VNGTAEHGEVITETMTTSTSIDTKAKKNVTSQAVVTRKLSFAVNTRSTWLTEKILYGSASK
jgi:hypothetical protein